MVEHSVQDPVGVSAEPEEGLWSGSVDAFRFEIERDPSGDLLVSFFLAES